MKALFALLLIGICQALHQAHILDRRQPLATAGAAVMASYFVSTGSRYWRGSSLRASKPKRKQASTGERRLLVWWVRCRQESYTPFHLILHKYNAWGICTNDSGGNACTYVPLKQRIPAYSKYAFNIALGAKEYQ
jgi:hypothetical protein